MASTPTNLAPKSTSRELPSKNYAGVTLATGTNATSDPFTPANSLNGFSTGFGFASFLLGDYNSTTQSAPYDYRMGYQQWALFLQDSWKVTRKLTLDYGLRYDLATQPHEQYGRLGQFDETLANANAGGHPGATIYASTCGCQFYQPSYPYAIGPRLGVAYQIDPKTVFRGGWGVEYRKCSGPPAALSVPTESILWPPTARPTFPPASQFVNIETPGAIVAADLARHQSEHLSGCRHRWVRNRDQACDARREPKPAAPQKPIQRRHPARDHQELRHGSGVRGQSRRLAVGPTGRDEPNLSGHLRTIWLVPLPRNRSLLHRGGVCANSTYNNNNDRVLLADPISSTAVIQKLASVGISSILPYSGFPTSTALSGASGPLPTVRSD